LLEGQPRQLETPSALVSRFGGLLVHGLPAEYEADFADRLRRVDRDAAFEAGRAAIHPDALVVVVVADAAQVLDRLRSLDWAALETIED
jgi:zinc protease